MKKYSYVNKYERIGTIGATFFILGLILIMSPNLRQLLGIEANSILVPFITGVGSFIFGLKSLLFHFKGWGVAIGIIDRNVETPFPSKYGKIKLFLSGIFFSILGLVLSFYAIISL